MSTTVYPQRDPSNAHEKRMALNSNIHHRSQQYGNLPSLRSSAVEMGRISVAAEP
jgi:hypothetical protein